MAFDGARRQNQSLTGAKYTCFFIKYLNNIKSVFYEEMSSEL